jgi:hypothetical protein
VKTQTLSICVPNTGCTRACPYCISKITGNTELTPLFLENIHSGKLETFARNTGVTNILLSGKGDPLKSRMWLDILTKNQFIRKYPLELQTNGDLLDQDVLEDILTVNTVALSVDSIRQFLNLWEKISWLKKRDKVVRITYLLRYANEWMGQEHDRHDSTLNSILAWCKESKVDQLTFRRITYPNTILTVSPEVKWIDKNVPLPESQKWFDNIQAHIRKFGNKIRQLNFGTSVYDMRGVAVTAFDYCVQELAAEDDIRTLIYQEDGHLYTSWSSKASIIF